MTKTEQPLIQVRGLLNRFGNQIVHENLDLDVCRGEILGVVGGSGTGKSVLLRSIVGLHNPDAGDIQLFSEQLNTLSAERRSQLEQRFGILFQQGALFTSLTVLENTAREIGAREVSGDTKITKVSIVGVGMRSHAGVASRMFEALAKESINIQMISTSEIKVSVVIEEKYLELAVRALHTAFELDASARQGA